MSPEIIYQEEFPIEGGNFINAGESSCRIRNILKQIGIDSNVIRRVGIAAYEAEMNVVMYARRGSIRLAVTAEKVFLRIEDEGQGIPDIEQAMQPGYSTATTEMRELGFGAGMGLPNIKKNSDLFDISSTVGKGTRLDITIRCNGYGGNG
jgi:anti-sigma regulatory factor (Ser/Thr protein kinase)